MKRLRALGSPEDCGTNSGDMDVSISLCNVFDREIQILASIRHPNVVNFIGCCNIPPNLCLVTEYCARGSLDRLLHKSGAPCLAASYCSGF